MDLQGRFSLSSAALARMRAVTVVEVVPEVHRAVIPTYGSLCTSCNGPLRAAWHHGTIYSCLHQQDGHNERCSHGCNHFGAQQ